MCECGDCRLYLIGLSPAVLEEHLIELIGLLLQLDLIDRRLREHFVAHQVLVLV